MRPSAILAIAAAIALGLSACGSTSADPAAGSVPSLTAPSTESAPEAGTPSASADAGSAPDAASGASTPGAFLTKAEFQDQAAARAGTKVVYFFHADWCPSCRATDAAIAADGLPDGLTLVKVDYDTDTDLRKEYGITQQHTFVQVDPQGKELAKWTGSISGADIEAQTV